MNVRRYLVGVTENRIKMINNVPISQWITAIEISVFWKKTGVMKSSYYQIKSVVSIAVLYSNEAFSLLILIKMLVD